MQAHGGNLKAARARYGNLDFLDFSANINPLGPPQGVLTALRDNLAEIIHYPEPCGYELKEKLSTRLGVAVNNIILGNGAVELIYLIAHTLRPKSALIPTPTFSEYAHSLNALGTQITYIMTSPSGGFKLNPDLVNFNDADIMFLCNPNNPTGHLLPEDDFIRLIDRAQKESVFLVVDESFMDFVAADKQWRAYRYLQDYPRLFVLYSLTKFYAIPGLRLGCGFGNAELIVALESAKDPWNVNSLALAAGIAALDDHEFDTKTRLSITTERDYLRREVAEITGLNAFPAEANFLLVQNLSTLNGVELVDKLGQNGILIRDCSAFPGLGPDFFRIAVKSHQANERLIEILGKIIGRNKT